MSDFQQLMTSINSKYPSCVDGRKAYGYFSFNRADGNWQIDKQGLEAEAENGPQFLGASLLFVAALEVIGEVKDRVQAFDLVEKASQEVGLSLQVHIDDLHGQIKADDLSDQELVQAVVDNNVGCGFSKYHWQEQGVEVIQMAKDRGWRLELLVGEHEEDGAISNFMEGQTFDVAAGVNQGQAAFNQDVQSARKVFAKLAELIEQPEFAQKAENWMMKTYADVVVALKGVSSADEIVELGK